MTAMCILLSLDNTIVLFHSNFSPSGEQPEHHKLVH